ncbi:MAG: Nif11-like leader peptide family natural product precursor [Gemmatimonadota bacterium]|nr:MAG: Nif11-like leader peptide family natural product precursor [Gemmatimonadota bacterium]
MSNQAATEFLQRLVSDEQLREQVRAAEKGRIEKAPVLVEQGARIGLDFTAAELADVLDALHRHKIGALSEDDLIAVAGGLVDVPGWHPDHD